MRFSIGAGDRQALQPSLSPTLPVTNTAVYTFFHQLGTSFEIAHILISLRFGVMFNFYNKKKKQNDNFLQT